MEERSKRIPIYWNSKTKSPVVADISYSVKNHIRLTPGTLNLEVGPSGEAPEQEIALVSIDGAQPFNE